MTGERTLENQVTHEWYWVPAAAIDRAKPAGDGPQDWDGWRYVELDPLDWPADAGEFSASVNRWGPPFPPAYMRDWGPKSLAIS